MSTYPGGWLDLASGMPKRITDAISKAAIYDDPTTTDGVVQQSTTFNTPTGGSWVATPISLDAEPIVYPINLISPLNMQVKSEAMNMQTKFADLTDPPPPLQNLIFAYGNADEVYDYQMDIYLDLGGSNYDLFEISVMENAATSGDVHGNIEVIDFGAGPYTGSLTLSLIFTGYFGPLNIGIRLESTGNTSSIFELRTVIMPSG